MSLADIRAYDEHAKNAEDYIEDTTQPPESLKRYEEALKKADFAFNKGHNSDGAYEDANEVLSEVVSDYELSYAQMFFDRDISVYHNSVTSVTSAHDLINRGAGFADPAAAPRLCTSHSQYVQHKPQKKRKAAQQAKIDYLQREFDAICYIDVSNNAEAKRRSAEQLQAFIKNTQKKSPYKV